MKTQIAYCLMVLLTVLSLEPSSRGQGIFLYDQQSAIEGARAEGGGSIAASQTIGQSFTPTNSAVGFVRLWLVDAVPGNGMGASVYINLMSNAINGAVLASTDPVFMPDNFGRSSDGYVNFFFSSLAPVTPGMTYFFQAILQSGNTMSAAGDTTYNYAGGVMFFQNTPNPSVDLWFREGIVVPEPSSLSLLISSAVLFYVRRKKNQKRSVG